MLRPPTRPLPAPLSEHLWTWEPEDQFVRTFHLHPSRPPLRARSWGPVNRFDPHIRDRHQRPRDQPDGRGVNYLAWDLGCALAEAFPERAPEVPICPNQFAILAAPQAPVTLLDLRGEGALQIGAVAPSAQATSPAASPSAGGELSTRTLCAWTGSSTVGLTKEGQQLPSGSEQAPWPPSMRRTGPHRIAG